MRDFLRKTQRLTRHLYRYDFPYSPSWYATSGGRRLVDQMGQGGERDGMLAKTRFAAPPIISTFRTTAARNWSAAINASLPGAMKRVMRWQRSTICAGRADHPSQWRRLAEDALAHVPVQGLLGTDMDLHPKQILEIFNQTSVIEKTAAWFPSDQQVEVAIFIGFIGGHRAEHAQTVRARREASRRIWSRCSLRNVSRVTMSILSTKEFRELFLGRGGLRGNLTREAIGRYQGYRL